MLLHYNDITQKSVFPLSVSSVIVTKSAVPCEFGHIYYIYMKTKILAHINELLYNEMWDVSGWRMSRIIL